MKRLKDGFTLIELLVSLGIMGLVIVSFNSLFFATLKGSKKADIQQKMKQSGDYALNVMATKIRNAQSVSVCSANSLTIVNPDGSTSAFSLGGNQIIADGSGLTDSVFIASAPPVSGKVFSCPVPPLDKPQLVTVSFILSKTGAIEETVQESFQTMVSPRSY